MCARGLPPSPCNPFQKARVQRTSPTWRHQSAPRDLPGRVGRASGMEDHTEVRDGARFIGHICDLQESPTDKVEDEVGRENFQ